MDATTRAAHWATVHGQGRETDRSWYQEHAVTTMNLLTSAGVTPEHAVLDVGGGASTLVDDLVAAGFGDVTVLDISEQALAIARARIPAAPVAWLVQDVVRWEPTRRYQVWHDRAVFHFLLDDDDERAAYRVTLRQALAPAGIAVVATFAEDGPTTCSGLPVRRYDLPRLVDALGPGLRVL